MLTATIHGSRGTLRTTLTHGPTNSTKNESASNTADHIIVPPHRPRRQSTGDPATTFDPHGAQRRWNANAKRVALLLTVSHDPDTVEFQLLGGELTCPLCPGRLRPWGFGVRRSIRYLVPVVNRWLIPRRGRCSECAATHILLPSGLAARRADDGAIIAEAVEMNIVAGAGHRRIAVVLGRPETTVRGWLRDFTASAPAIAAAFSARVHRGTAEALGFWPAPAATGQANALAMVMAHARVLANLHGTGSDAVLSMPWHQGALFAHGPWFFSLVGWPDRFQHEPALPLGR